jgi:DNA-directed RNA polymerase specialized sigma24 family protein
MTEESAFFHKNLIGSEPMTCPPADAGKTLGLLEATPKDEETVKEAFAGMEDMFDLIAAGLYSMASMLVGEGEQSVRLVETALETADVSACDDMAQARQSSRQALSSAAIELLARRDPDQLAAPEHLEPSHGCIQDDDLDAAGVSGEELTKMMGGGDRERMREWLASLPTASRVIFVLRAVAGFRSEQIAQLLAEHGGGRAARWNADAVREIFRQALCSLASQLLLHASTAR